MGYLKFLTIAMGVMISLPAQAGFQFSGSTNSQPQIQAGGLLPTPPSSEPQMPAIPPTPVVKQPVVNIQPQKPVINMQPPQQQATPQPIISAAPQNNVQTQPNRVRWNANPVAPQPTMAMPVQSQKNQFDMAVGFGEDVPLSVALQQVIPQNYNHTIDPQMAQGKKVSWQGGKQWPDVLDDMIQPLGMQARIQGGDVVITGGNVAPAAPMRVNQVAALSPQIQPYAPQIQSDARPQPPIAMAPQQSMASAPMTMAPTNLMPNTSPAVDISVQTTEVKKDENESIVPEVTVGQWTAQSGTSLRTILESWSNLEGVDLFWSSDFDYPLVGDVNITGSFEEAVETLLSGFADAQPKPVGRLHPNLPHGPAVLLIETKQIVN